MDPQEHLETLRRESAAFAAAARKGLEAQVPSCPEWTVLQLVEHLGNVHRFFGNIVREKSTVPVPPPPAGEPSVEWFEESADALATALEDAGTDSPAWNWSLAADTSRWQYRRMAQETAVHRWDAQLAHGAPEPIDTELALDGVDEMLDVFLPATVAEVGDAAADLDLGGSVHMHATDSPHGEWIVRLDKGELLVGHGHEKADAAIRGTASDLLLFCWGRIRAGDERFEVFGDRAVLDRLSADLAR